MLRSALPSAACSKTLEESALVLKIQLRLSDDEQYQRLRHILSTRGLATGTISLSCRPGQKLAGRDTRAPNLPCLNHMRLRLAGLLSPFKLFVSRGSRVATFEIFEVVRMLCSQHPQAASGEELHLLGSRHALLRCRTELRHMLTQGFLK
ncbi:hypothetical protein WJX73_009960 [Symbiochloris irregularis]|uniref:LAGLIDADG homing endonuclease n=1 Tax=Symbiochloris irregularis TaxID=706552 RepID=A0AAW1NLS0_9CHLO